jgi:hypothetical protein
VESPDWFPLAAWPEPGGFLPCANTDRGDVLGWLTVGPPERWEFTVRPRHEHGVHQAPGTFTEVLLGWVRGEVDIAGLRADREDEIEPPA